MVKLSDTTQTAKAFACGLSFVLERTLFRNTDECPRREKIQRVIEAYISNQALEAVGKEAIVKSKTKAKAYDCRLADLNDNYMEDYHG